MAYHRVGVSVSGTDLGEYGIGLYTRELLRSLERYLVPKEVEVHVFGTRAELSAYFPSAGKIPEGFVLRELPRYCAKAFINSLYHKLVLPRVVVASSIDVFVLPSGNRRVMSSRRFKTLAVVHDISQHFMEYKYGFLHERHLDWVVLRTLENIDKLVAVSKFTANDLEQVLGREGEVVTIHNGAVDRRVSVDVERCLRYFGGKPFLLYPSRLEHPGKNHLNLLAAFAASGLSRDYQLVFTGKDWGARPLIDARIAELDLQAAVSVIGHQGEDEYNRLFNCAAAVLCVGVREGFGLHGLEAAMLEKPVLASNTGAMQEFLCGYAVYCDPMDVDSITAGLRAVVETETQTEKRKFAELYPNGYFSWERCGEALCKEIEGLMDN